MRFPWIDVESQLEEAFRQHTIFIEQTTNKLRARFLKNANASTTSLQSWPIFFERILEFSNFPSMDRLSQLQDCFDKLVEMMYTSTGVLQRDAPLVKVGQNKITAWTEEQIEKNTQDLKRILYP
jgi:hypothetical protein